MVVAFPGGSVAAADGIVRARTHLPVPPFNGVWGAARDVRTDVVLAAVDEFAAGDLPWNLQLRPGYPAELDALLADRGLVVTADIPFMVLTDVAPLTEALARVPATAHQVAVFDDVDAALGLLEQGFGMPPELTRRQMPLRLFLVDGAEAWLVRVQDRDVSTAFGYRTGEACGVFNVATPETERGHGYGGAATAQAVLSAYAAGATYAYLQSSPMGFPVYQRLGFRTVELWRQWMPAEYVAEH
jgi:hypothetical protein